MNKFRPESPVATKRVRLAAIGLRGIPDVQGGIESHAQSLYPLLVEAGFDVTVHARKAFVAGDAPRLWRGVRIEPSWSPRRAGWEALVHSVVAMLRAKRQGAELLHIHGIGPALVAPIARLLGFRVVVTHHGRDYERDKWGVFAKRLLRMGERLGARYAHRVICVAQNDAERLNELFGAGTAVSIPNGAPRLAPPTAPEVLSELGLVPGRYVLNVARLVPEKRQLGLVAAFGKLAPPDWKLVLVGSAQNRSEYPDAVERAASRFPHCVMAGQRSGAELSSLYANAGLFVLPSAHEGLPITLLEALSFGLPCIASDIPANREIGLPDDCYFPVDDDVALACCLTREVSRRDASVLVADRILGQSFQRLPPRFHWESVAALTGRLLVELAGRKAMAAASG